MLDLVIRGGQVVTPQAVGEMDVGIQSEKIVAVGWPGTLAAEAGRVIEARGKIVIPGGSSRTRTSVFPCRSSGRATRT